MTVKYPDPLYIEQLDDVWVQGLADFRLIILEEGQPDTVIIVPKGFKSDYASVPKWPLVYERFGGRGKKPAYGHDFGYSLLYTGDKDRKWWDAYFHHGLLAIGINSADADAMYEGVRIGGDSHWRTG